MKFIESLKEGMHVSEVYLCKTKTIAMSKTGKEYASLSLHDKTGSIDAKIWDLYSPGISDVDAMTFVVVDGDVTSFNNVLQLKVARIREADEKEYTPSDYVPVSKKDIDKMFGELKDKIKSIKNPFLSKLLTVIFIDDFEFQTVFKSSSAAKTVHHGFLGGLLEHTLGVVKLCEYFCNNYESLNRDLLITSALCHDIGKTRELSAFPANDYTDEGQLVGHIVIGVEILKAQIDKIPGFPKKLSNELIHCILAHHGELEYGSPKKPALIEALALNLADNADAKLETFIELLAQGQEGATGWLGYNKLLESNYRKTSV